MLPKIFKPKYFKNLIRLGCKLDGGYVLPKSAIKNIKYCITFGLGDNFSFEEELQKLNPIIKIFAYDPYVNFNFWTTHFFYWLWHTVRFRKFNQFRYLHFFKYLFFFKFNKNKHYQKKITKYYSIDKVLKETKVSPKKTLLKIDIDGDEYKIINNINFNSFLCVIIEFEQCDKKLNNIKKFIKKNKKLSLAHIHANNFNDYGDNQIPKTLELTFVQSNLLKSIQNNKRKYPIKGIDYPNNVMKKDLFINFK